MALTKDEKTKLDETHDMVIELKTILLGKNHDKGLAGWISDLDKGYNKLRKNFWTLIGILAGSGIIGGGIAGLLNGG